MKKGIMIGELKIEITFMLIKYFFLMTFICFYFGLFDILWGLFEFLFYSIKK